MLRVPEKLAVINNNGPLVALWTLDLLSLLRDLYTEVLIPQEVQDEFLATEQIVRQDASKMPLGLRLLGWRPRLTCRFIRGASILVKPLFLHLQKNMVRGLLFSMTKMHDSMLNKSDYQLQGQLVFCWKQREEVSSRLSSHF